MTPSPKAYCGCPASPVSYPVCTECSSEGHGNIFCATCVTHTPLDEETKKKLLEEIKKRGEGPIDG